jgi:hypothetical protein
MQAITTGITRATLRLVLFPAHGCSSMDLRLVKSRGSKAALSGEELSRSIIALPISLERLGPRELNGAVHQSLLNARAERNMRVGRTGLSSVLESY